MSKAPKIAFTLVPGTVMHRADGAFVPVGDFCGDLPSGLESCITWELTGRHYLVLVNSQDAAESSDTGQRSPQQTANRSTGFLLGTRVKIA